MSRTEGVPQQRSLADPQPSEDHASPALADALFARQSELTPGDFAAEVCRRNDSLHMAQTAWKAAAESYPQTVAFDDSWSEEILSSDTWRTPAPNEPPYSDVGNDGRQVSWRGKLALRAQVAASERQAVRIETLDDEQRVARAARLAFLDYGFVFRELQLNHQHSAAIHDLRKLAGAAFDEGRATRHELLALDVELAQLERHRIDLGQAECAARARLNALLHRAPGEPLPPPGEIPCGLALPPLAHLQDLAVILRPELAAHAAQLEAERAQLARAEHRREATGKVDHKSREAQMSREALLRADLALVECGCISAFAGFGRWSGGFVSTSEGASWTLS